jgi:hypothetical protein
MEHINISNINNINTFENNLIKLEKLENDDSNYYYGDVY